MDKSRIAVVVGLNGFRNGINACEDRAKSLRVKGDIESRETERKIGRKRLGLFGVADSRKIAFLHYDEIKVPFRVTILPGFFGATLGGGLRT